MARNEASFRSINERLQQDLRRVPLHDGDLAAFVCECSGPDCRATLVGVEMAKYAEVRTDDRRFLVVPGHDIPEVEDVVEQGDGYAVVEKHDDVRHIVER